MNLVPRGWRELASPGPWMAISAGCGGTFMQVRDLTELIRDCG